MQIILAFMGLLYTGMPTSYATPNVKLIPNDVVYFSNEGSLTLICTVDQDVHIASVIFKRDGMNYVGIFNPTIPQCTATKYIGDDISVYSMACDQERNFTMIKRGTSANNHRKNWMCTMNSLPSVPCGGSSNPCLSQNVSSIMQVPVTTVQLMTGSGQTLSSPVNIVRGQSTGIRCSTAPNGSRPRATFQWYIRQGNQSPVLIVDQSISLTPDPGTVPGQSESDIVISYSTWTLTGNASYQDMYIYCQARDETNTENYVKSAEVQINIVYPPVVNLFPNQYVYNITEVMHNFIFTCNIVEAKPLPQANSYSWFHKTSIIPGQTASTFTLPSVQRADAGEYRCTARNDYGSGTSEPLDLNVQYRPTISLVGTIDVEEAGTLSVTCSVSANPPPSVIWTRSGKVLSNSSVLVVPNISRLNDGEYICTASNVLYPTGQVPVMKTATDTLIVNVSYGPGNSATIYPNVMMYEVEEGKTAQNIVCSAMCNPECSYKWLRNNTQISNQGTLSLGLVHRNMTGRYVCEAYNTVKGGIRSSTVTIEIKIKYAPIVKLQAEVRNINPFIVKEGHMNVVLMCEIIAAYPLPTLYIWTHENEVQNGSGSTFTIPVATRQIDGIWGCKGINNYGTPSESQLQIDVQYGPIIDPIGNETAIQGQLFSVACNVKSNPPPVSISWIKDNNATFPFNTSVLTINNVSRNDSGTYRCTAINKIHPSGENEVSLNGSKWFYLNVQSVGMMEPEMKGSANVAAIAGGIGAAVVVVVILVVLFFVWRKKTSMKNSSGFINSIQGRSNQTGHLYANTSYSGDVSNTVYESLQACKTEASPYQALNSSSTESSDQNKDWSESMTIRSVGAGKIYINIANTSTLGDKEYESLQSNQIETNPYQVLNDCSKDCSQPINIR